MKNTIITIVTFLAIMTSISFAKRLAPSSVPAIAAGGIEYRVPHKEMGCIEAWDVKRKGMIWRRQIYVVKYHLDLERDVQDVFIKTIKRKKNTLVIENERESRYQLDLKTLEIKVLKGSLIESFK